MSISVVIPAFNAEKYLRETLKSVIAQTLPPDEVVVIDDGSTDSTAAIAESFGPPVKVIRTANQRAAVGRNLGVENTRGEWIAFLDADDMWQPVKLERQMAELIRHPEADLCYTGWADLLQEGNVARVIGVVEVPPASETLKALLSGTTFLPSTVMIRKSTFLAVGGFDPARRYTQDWDLWLRLVNAGMKFAACREPLTIYRTHSENMSSNAVASLESAKEVYKKHVPSHLHPMKRWFHQCHHFAERESGAASQLYDQGDPGYIALKLKSILHDPFFQPGRYTFLARVLFSRLKKA